MTKTFSASVKGWSEKAKRNSRLIVMEASEAVYSAMTERQAGVGETGGSFVTGKVPVDTGFLANSVHVEISGALVGQGTPDFMGVISGMKIGDIDLFEVNEAFASIPLAWLQATGADPERLNVNGGAIALGHPLGGSGTKLMSTLVNALHKRGKRYGLQTMCEGGGLANVTIVERL